MLRVAVLVLAITTLAIALCLRISGEPAAMPFAIWGALLLVACLFERWRYQTPAGQRGDDWSATDERFVDPESGRQMRVFYNARTGDRRYEVDGGSA